MEADTGYSFNKVVKDLNKKEEKKIVSYVWNLGSRGY